MKGLFSGKKIKELKVRSQRITRSQTAANACAAIISKYGKIDDNAHYSHVGKGNWKKYSLTNDKMRTGKLAGSIKEWRERPHKLDWAGVDTKSGEKKARFSLGSIKQSGRLTGRKGKPQLKANSANVLKKISKPINKPVTKTDYNRIDLSKWTGQFIKKNIGFSKVTKTNTPSTYQAGYIAITKNDNRFVIYIHKPLTKFYVQDSFDISCNESGKPDRVGLFYDSDAQAISEIKKFVAKYEKPKREFSFSQLKLVGKPSNRKSKVQPRGSGKAVIKHIPRSPLEEKRLRLLASMVRIEVTTDPHLYYEKWEDQLKKTFATNYDYKKWRDVNRKYLDDHPRIVKDLAYTHIAGGTNQNFRDSKPVKPVTEYKPSKLIKTEPKKQDTSKPVKPTVSPIKTVTINGKKFTINASNAVAFVTEMRTKGAKQKLASMIKQAKANEFKGKDVSDDWAKIVTFISENMGSTNLKRLPSGPEGFARFMGKKANYQSVNEKAYQIKKRNDDIKKNQVSTENLRENLKRANDGLRRELQNLTEQKQMLKSEKDVNMIYELQKEIKYTKSEIEDYKKHIATNTKLLNERVRQPHPNNIRSKAARAKLPKNPVMKNPGKLARRTGNKLKPVHKPALKGNYVYASFQRPIWAGFNPGVQFQKVLGPLDKYSDPRWNRNPHDVIITSTPISKEKQYDLQLTDLKEGAKIKELIKYVDKFDFLTDNMSGQLKDNIIAGRITNRESVDKYAEKGKRIVDRMKH